MNEPIQQADRPIPILTTRKEVVLPGVVTPLEVGRRASIAAVDAAMAEGSTILLVPQKDPRVDVPKPDDLVDVGVLAEIVQMARQSATRYTVIARSGARVHLDKVESAGSYLHAHTSSMATVTTMMITVFTVSCQNNGSDRILT